MHSGIKAALAVALLVTTSACASLAGRSSLQITTFKAGESSIFPVSSNLIEGPNELLLVDAQFQRNDAQQLVEMIKAKGKPLTTIFISHGDPDYYFGLDVVTQAFPEAEVLSSPATREYILASMEPKKDHWGPILADNAPEELIVPDALKGGSLEVDGEVVKVIGLDGPDPKHTFLWVPSVKTIVGGVSVFDGLHLWMADSQTQDERRQWLQTLDTMLALEPEVVIPGHYNAGSAKNADSIDFTARYIADFTTAANQAADSAELVTLMKQHYPDLGGESSLELSAKVAMGEMTWP